VTYFGVLGRFVAPPLAILTGVTLYDLRCGRRLSPSFRTWPSWAILAAHVGVALLYTTPWDNYLVATRVWWYDPSLVTGITLGWVPIEEYTFFVVQTLLTGLWLLTWMRHAAPPGATLESRPRLRWIATAVAGALWLVWLALLLSGWGRGRYMALLLAWVIPPIALQLAFGADILWHYRRLVLTGMLPPFVYLCMVDAIAIGSGTWTINPERTLGVDVAGVLPLEEITFFLVTNLLIVFGMTLTLARESHVRAGTRVGRRISGLTAGSEVG